MDAAIALTPAHYFYLIGVIAIVVTMVLRANVVVPAIIATFAVGFAYSGKLLVGLQSIFMGSLVAAQELFDIFLVIALMTALLNGLRELGADVRMVQPFRRVMVNGHIAYFILALITYLISLFFWPTPAVPLVGAILMPAAIYAGLSPLGAAAAVAIAGQGMALSSDYVMKVAPGISAKAAGVAMPAVANMGMLLSLVTGGVALVLGWFLIVRKSVKRPNAENLARWENVGYPSAEDRSEVRHGSFAKAELALSTMDKDDMPLLASPSGAAVLPAAFPVASASQRREFWSKFFAIVTPLVFLAMVVVMTMPQSVGASAIRGGDAASFIGGTAAILMILTTLSYGPKGFLDRTATHIIDGLVFAFKAMGAVLPIAGFFFIGSSDTAGQILGLSAGQHAPALLFELVQSCSHYIPHSSILVSFGVLLMGMITGVDGSGFAGLPLTGALSGALGPVAHIPVATLAAIGQMGATWTGGGTLIAWSSLIAVTGFARVHVLDAVRALFIPVVCGLIVATLVGVAIS